MSQEEKPEGNLKKLDPIALAILAALDDGADWTAQEIAHMIAEVKKKPKDEPDLWRKYLPSVKQQALFLARNGYIHWVRKGEIVTDFHQVKGLVKYRLIDDMDI
ncbi:MAG: DUF3253 domain-containing protein [Alphaproteobacteria bacterium]